PRERFKSCVHHRFRHRRTSRSSSRPSPCSSSPTCYPRPRSQPRAISHLDAQVFSSCLSLARTGMPASSLPLLL
ncbi:hypothetical protein ACJX0J_042385, partial [Zea mays]